MQSNSPKGLSRFSTKLFIVVLLLLTLSSVAVAGGLAYMYFQTPKTNTPNTEHESENLIQKVNQLITLPDEIPTIATVTDINKLAGQTFFARAENGDQVLIYQEAKKAYLYRPSQHKLIEVAPLTVNQPSPSNEPIQQEITVSIYNGTTINGLTNRFEKELATLHPSLKVNTKKNAATTHQKSMIIDTTGLNEQLINELATELNLIVATIPEGETIPASDLLIILGSDKNPTPASSSALFQELTAPPAE